MLIGGAIFFLTPKLELAGDKAMEVSMKDGYQEPGYTAKFAFINITSRVEIDSGVNDKKVGIYEVKYAVSFLGKEASEVRRVSVVDKEPPEITLQGGEEIEIEQFSSFEDPGFDAVDDSDGDITDKVIKKGIVDTYNPGSYSISYRATDSYGNESLVERKVEVGKSAGQKEQKTIYLTFDDGPSEGVTPKILEILRKNKVPATFFILDYGDNEEKKRLLKTAISEGHTIGIHGYSHDYDEIYKSVPDYMENVSKLDKKIQRDLDYKPFVMRFPGGSSNTVSVSLKKGIMSELVKKVQEEGYYYSDWNVDSTDASGNNIDKNTIISSVEKNCSKKGYNIVLMHDTDAKRTTAEALPEIIKWAKKEGYTFKAMERGGPTVHHRVNN